MGLPSEKVDYTVSVKWHLVNPFQETRFRFYGNLFPLACLGLVNSAKNDPAKKRRVNIPVAGKFTHGYKKTIPAVLLVHWGLFAPYLTIMGQRCAS